jgi:hypothetical protein
MGGLDLEPGIWNLESGDGMGELQQWRDHVTPFFSALARSTSGAQQRGGNKGRATAGTVGCTDATCGVFLQSVMPEAHDHAVSSLTF